MKWLINIIALSILFVSLVIGCVQGSTPVGAQIKHVDNCSYGSDREMVCTVSIFSLISNPERYYGKRLHVVGYLAIDVGALKIWATQESFLRDIDANSIHIDVPLELSMELVKDRNRTYCAIVGKFEESPDNRLGLHSTNSAFTAVSRIFPVDRRADSVLDWQILMEVDQGPGGSEQTKAGGIEERGN